MTSPMHTVLTTMARPRVEAAAAGLHGLEIAVGFENVPAKRRVPISTRGGRGGGSRGGSAGKAGRRSGSRSSPRGRFPGGRGGASRGSGRIATRIENTPGLMLPRLAAIHEFGAPRANIPARRFMARAFSDNRDKIRRLAIGVLRKMTEGRPGTRAAKAMAEDVKRMVQHSIASTTTPPMSQRHRLRRMAMGDPNPQLLVDTRQLIEGVKVTVTKGAGR